MVPDDYGIMQTSDIGSCDIIHMQTLILLL